MIEEKPVLIIVMPTYNEEECIREVVHKWLGMLEDQFPSENVRFLIINDGSKDQTPELLDELDKEHDSLTVFHQKNGGHGKALLTGYEKALELNPHWIFQVDSDDQFVPEDFADLWNKRERSNFILGHRKVRYDEPHRLLITRFLRLVLYLLFGVKVKDSNIPYRLIHGSYLKILLEQIPNQPFAPNIFLVVLAARDGQELFEIPITHKERETGSVSIVQWRLVKACFRSTLELLNFSMTLKRRVQAIEKARIEEKIV